MYKYRYIFAKAHCGRANAAKSAIKNILFLIAKPPNFNLIGYFIMYKYRHIFAKVHCGRANAAKSAIKNILFSIF